MYNFDNVEAEFIDFLQTRKNLSPATKSNYIADFRTFWQWFALTQLKTKHRARLAASQDTSFLPLTTQSVWSYGQFLVHNGAATATVHRHNATIRLFISLCVQSHRLPDNHGIELRNDTLIVQRISIKNYQSISQGIISDFTNHLVHSKTATTTIRNYTSDVEQFLGWFETVIPA